MELEYIWIKQYGIIENQGFNFSREYEFEYDYEKKEVKVEKRNISVPQGFFGEKISNVIAVVGKNGSGKSTLFEFLNKLRNSDNLHFIQQIENFKYICIYNTQEGLFYEHWLDEKLIVQEGIKENEFEITEWGKQYQRIHSKQAYLEKFYTSNIMNSYYDRKQINPWYEGLEDFVNNPRKNLQEFYYTRTLNHLKFLWDKNNNEILRRSTNKDIQKLGNINSVVLNVKGLYSYVEKWRRIKENIEEKRKQKSELEVTDNDEEKNINDLDGIYRSLDKMLREEYEVDRGKTRAIITEEKIKSKILDYVFCNMLDLVSQNDEVYGKLIFNKIFIDDKRSFVEKLNEVIKQVEEWDKNKKYKNKYTVFQPLIEMDIIKGKDTIKYDNIDYRVETIFGSEIVLDISLFKKMHEGESKYLYSIIEQFELSYVPSLSTGEEVLLDILATFYNNRTSFPLEKKIDNMLIVIDEGDEHFHPEWQRRYVDILCTFFSELYPNLSTKIILISHSPFVVSDLPRENIILLDKDNIGNCKVVKDKEIKTFGANIHTLLANSFFMESTLGEFAKRKISETIKDLDNKIKDEEEIGAMRKEEIKYIVDNVGEPLIKRKLQEMYDRAFPIESKNHLDLIEKLEKEINELTKDKKNPKNGLEALQKLKDKITEYEDLLKNVGDIDDKN